MKRFNPRHPGETLREDVLPEIKLTVTALASTWAIRECLSESTYHGHSAAPLVADCGLRFTQICKHCCNTYLVCNTQHT